MPANPRANDRSADEDLLDAINLRLVAELQADARLSLAELGRRVVLSAPAVAERLRRLEQEGLIRGYHADVDPRALGFGLAVHLRIRPAPRQLAEVADLARETPEVIECHRVTGDDCYVMTMHVRDVEHLEEIIDEFAAYGQTTTSIIQSSPVPGRAVSLVRCRMPAR
jgi:Lrp/AsnC family leucine-responsive transcriptional regulator